MTAKEDLVDVYFHCYPEGRDLDVGLRELSEPGVENNHCWSIVTGQVQRDMLDAYGAPCPKCGNGCEIEPITALGLLKDAQEDSDGSE